MVWCPRFVYRERTVSALADLTKATSQQLTDRRRELIRELTRLDEEEDHRAKVYRREHAIPGCSEQRVPGECCMDMDCPVHGIAESPDLPKGD